MSLADLLSQYFAADYEECWERERTASPVRAFAVRLHAAGLSLRETEAVLRILGVKRSFQAIHQWVHRVADSGGDPPMAQPRRVGVDETAVKINGEWSWLYAAIDLDTKLILHVAVFERHGIDPAAAFLHEVTEKHDCSNTVFLADAFGYRTAFARLGLTGRVDYSERNLIEKWFQTLKMRVDRFHNSWVGSRLSVRQWLAVFAHYYNVQRPHQALNGRTPAQEVN